jgi:hypothetical protein
MTAHRRTTNTNLFDANLLELLACQAIAYRRDTEGDDALRFALIVAGLMFSQHATATKAHI